MHACLILEKIIRACVTIILSVNKVSKQRENMKNYLRYDFILTAFIYLFFLLSSL